MTLSKIFLKAADPNSMLEVDEAHNLEQDQAVLDRIRDILFRHNKEERFGVALLHKHFPMAADERILETFKPETRNLTLTIVNEKELGQETIPSVFRFTKD
jgi:hypothetical protein